MGRMGPGGGRFGLWGGPIGNPLLVKCLEFQGWVPAWSLDLPRPSAISSSHNLLEWDPGPPRSWLFEQRLIKLWKGQPGCLGRGVVRDADSAVADPLPLPGDVSAVSPLILTHRGQGRCYDPCVTHGEASVC